MRQARHGMARFRGWARTQDEIATVAGALWESIRISGVPGRIGGEAVIWSDEARPEAVPSER